MLDDDGKVKRLLRNDAEFYQESIDGPGIDKAAAPFRARVQSLGAQLAETEAAAAVIADLLELAWEVGRSEGHAGSAIAFDVAWLMGSGRREDALERADDLADETARCIEDMSRFENSAAKLEGRIAAGPSLRLIT